MRDVVEFVSSALLTRCHTLVTLHVSRLRKLSSTLSTGKHTYIHTSPGSPERLALSLEHVDHDDLVDVVACVRVDLGHVRACVSSLSS